MSNPPGLSHLDALKKSLAGRPRAEEGADLVFVPPKTSLDRADAADRNTNGPIIIDFWLGGF